MSSRKKKNAPASNGGPHTIHLNFSRDELMVLQRVAYMAGVNIATLLRVILALRVCQALPVVGPNK